MLWTFPPRLYSGAALWYAGKLGAERSHDELRQRQTGFVNGRGGSGGGKITDRDRWCSGGLPTFLSNRFYVLNILIL
jgi:hypothetical protein